MDVVRFGDGADGVPDVFAEFFAQLGAGLFASLERDKGDDRLTFDFMGASDHGGFGHGVMADQRTLDFGGAEAVAGDVEHVIDAADDPEIAVLVPAGAVTGEIESGNFAPVSFLIPRAVAVNGAEHGGPGFANDEFAAHVGSDFLAVVIDDGGINAEERKRRGAGLGRRGTGERGNHDRSGFGLPPGVDDGTASGADFLVIPHPRLGVDRLADRAEEAERGEIVFIDPFVAPFDEGADGGRRGVENGHAVVLDDAPEAVRVGPVRGTFIHQAGHAIGQRTVDQVAMAGDPADVGAAPIDVVLAEIENVFRRGIGLGEVTGCGVEDALGFSG